MTSITNSFFAIKRPYSNDVYDVRYVTNLFDRMSKTYGIANYISSFGFTERWRQRCVEAITWHTSVQTKHDWMSGTGECWDFILKNSKNTAHLTSIDISEKMHQKALAKAATYHSRSIDVLKADVLHNSIAGNSVDVIVIAFGLKTFSEKQMGVLAEEMARVLTKGGQCSVVEVSMPPNILLRFAYMFYLKCIIPLVGVLFMGNAPDYQMLGVYTQKFQNCKRFQKYLDAQGLQTQYKSYFFGCATGVFATK